MTKNNNGRRPGIDSKSIFFLFESNARSKFHCDDWSFGSRFIFIRPRFRCPLMIDFINFRPLKNRYFYFLFLVHRHVFIWPSTINSLDNNFARTAISVPNSFVIIEWQVPINVTRSRWLLLLRQSVVADRF